MQITVTKIYTAFNSQFAHAYNIYCCVSSPRTMTTAWDLPLVLLLFVSAQSVVYSLNLELASVVSAGFLCHSVYM